MAKGVFVHRSDTKYDDLPEAQYQFPKRYLNRARCFERDWVLYYEPRGGGGRLGYNAVARVQRIIPDPLIADMFLAIMEPGSYLPLDEFVPYLGTQGFLESDLAKSDGSLNKGRVQWAVRPVSDKDFFRILSSGFPPTDALPRVGDVDHGGFDSGLQEEGMPFGHDVERMRVEQRLTRTLRDRVFRQHVLRAYDSSCALTGLKFINGGGRAEVEAAHIKPVAQGGPDVVRNGLALSGTIHWMFDRGLISLSDESDILVSRQVNNPEQIWRLVNPDRKARLPRAQSQRPHPAYLRWHRQNCLRP